MTKPKRPRDTNQLAKMVVDIAVGEGIHQPDQPGDDGKNPAAVSLGRLGGKKGGAARAAALTPEKRKMIAKDAASKRWEKVRAARVKKEPV